MKITKPNVKIMPFNAEEMLLRVESAMRICYKSEGYMGEVPNEEFILKRINSGHLSTIEHAIISVVFTIDRGISHELVRHRISAFSQESTRYCVAGDTNLHFKNPHIKMTVEDLYNNIQNSVNGAWKRLSIRQLNEDTGQFQFSKIKNVIFNGVKPLLKITTELGYSLVCTPDHSIMTDNGYIECSCLEVGDSIYCNGITVSEEDIYKNYDWLYYQNITLNKTFVQIANEFNFNVSTLKKWGRKLNLPKKGTGYFNVGKEPWNKGLTENEDERVKNQAEALRKYHYDSSKKGQTIMKKDTSEYQKYLGDNCAICNSKEGLEVHHKDEDRDNNCPDNLITLCESCHQRVHSKNVEILFSDKIVSIEKILDNKVYDIEMENFHNFIANGIVVHNCNYSNDKFGNEITVIEPFFNPIQRIDEPTKHFKNRCSVLLKEWESACKQAETKYFNLLDAGATPQEARSVLPNSLKTEVFTTFNLREWRHFFSLRADSAAHPQMRQVAIPLLLKFKELLPAIFNDVPYDETFNPENYAEIITL